MIEQRYVIAHNEAPPSMNTGGAGSRRHWGAAHKEKMRWEGVYCALLMEQKVPHHMARCVVNVWVGFKTKHRRDVENYRSSVIKPFADCLVKGRWLTDDTEEFFQVSGFHLDTGLKLPRGVKGKLTIQLQAFYDRAAPLR